MCLLLGPEGKEDLAIARHQLDFFTHETNYGTIAEGPSQIHQRYDEVVKFFQEIGDPWQTALTISIMGLELGRRGDFTGAHQALEQSLRLFQECGDNINASLAKQWSVQIALDQGNFAEARAQAEENVRFYRQSCLNFLIDIPLWTLGVIAIREEDYPRAKEWYTECLLLDQQTGLRRQLAECFLGFAGIASAEKRFERAAQLLGVGEAEAEVRGGWENIDRIEFKRLTAVLREELGDTKLEALASQGRLMTREQAIAYALEE